MLTFSVLSPVSSVYIAGAGVLKLAGTGAAIAFILGGMVPAMLALLYAELGSAFPRAGGVYPPIAGILGPNAAFPFLIVTVLVQPAYVAFSAVGLAIYARVLFPALPLIPVALIAILSAAAIAVASIRTNAVVTGAFLAVEALALALLSGVALLHPAHSLMELIRRPEVLEGGVMKPAPFWTLALATVSGAWSCGGAVWAMYFAEEMKEARRTIGRVIAWTGLLASIVIAGPMLLVLSSARDLPGMLAAEAPVAFYLNQAGGPIVAAVVSFGVLAAVFNNLIAGVLAISRMIYATGRDGVWPGAVNRFLTILHPRLRSPLGATLALGLVAALACLAPMRALIVFLAGDVFPAIMISLAVLVGRPLGLTGRDFRAPLHPLVPIAGLLVAASFVLATYLDADAGRPSMIFLAGVFVISLAVHRLRRRRGSGWTMPGLREEEAPELKEAEAAPSAAGGDPHPPAAAALQAAPH
jgi:amino acid transporter